MIAILRDALERIVHDEGWTDAGTGLLVRCNWCGELFDQPSDCAEKCPRRLIAEALRAFEAAPGLEDDAKLFESVRKTLILNTGQHPRVTTHGVLAAITAHLRGAAK